MAAVTSDDAANSAHIALYYEGRATELAKIDNLTFHQDEINGRNYTRRNRTHSFQQAKPYEVSNQLSRMKVMKQFTIGFGVNGVKYSVSKKSAHRAEPFLHFIHVYLAQSREILHGTGTRGRIPAQKDGVPQLPQSDTHCQILSVGQRV